MSQFLHPDPTVIVIFGAGGDLAWRKPVPALYNLFLDGWLPDRFTVIGLDRKAMSHDEFHQRLRQGVGRFSRHGRADESTWHDFASHLSFYTADFGDAAAYTALADRLSAQANEWGDPAVRIFYQATPPALVEMIVIDHYLGKETVQNILAFRFANALFEPIWGPPLHRPRADHGGRVGGSGASGRIL